MPIFFAYKFMKKVDLNSEIRNEYPDFKKQAYLFAYFLVIMKFISSSSNGMCFKFNLLKISAPK